MNSTEYDIFVSQDFDEADETSFVDYGPDGEIVVNALPQMEG